MNYTIAILVSVTLILGGGVATGYIGVDPGDTVFSSVGQPDMQIDDVQTNGGDVNVTFTVSNPSEISGEVVTAEYGLRVGNGTVANGSTQNLEIPRSSNSTHKVSMTPTQNEISVSDTDNISVFLNATIEIGGATWDQNVTSDWVPGGVGIPTVDTRNTQYNETSGELKTELVVDNPNPVGFDAEIQNWSVDWNNGEDTGTWTPDPVDPFSIPSESVHQKQLILNPPDEIFTGNGGQVTTEADVGLEFSGTLRITISGEVFNVEFMFNEQI